MNQVLRKGDFVRVKSGSDFRAGQDGMVIDPVDAATVGLMFCFDRRGCDQGASGALVTGLVEAWDINELDLSSVEH